MLKGLGGLGALGDMAGMVQKAKAMQAKVADLQEELSRTVVSGESGGGRVRVEVTAKGEVTAIDIDPELVAPNEKEMVEDLILAAIRSAQAQGAEHSRAEMAKLTEGLGLPAGMKLPF